MKSIYTVSVGGTNLYESSGFWLDEPPAFSAPENNCSDLQISVPYADGTYDLTETLGITNGGRTLSFKLRCVDTGGENAIATDEATLRALVAGMSGVSVSDTWTSRTFNNCTCTSYDATFNELGYECTVDIEFYCSNATDADGDL